MFRAIVFDLDGTLLDTLDDLTDSVNASLAHFSLPKVTKENVRDSIGNGARRLIEGVVKDGAAYPEFEELLAYYIPYYQAHCREKTAPYEGILPMMQAAKKAGIKMAIVSNKGDGAVKTLSELYFPGLVEAAVGERPGIRRKPVPDSVLEAMRLLDSAPEETLYVGDSEVDYETAKNAGISCMLVSWGFRDREMLEKMSPDYLIDKPEELLTVI